MEEKIPLEKSIRLSLLYIIDILLDNNVNKFLTDDNIKRIIIFYKFMLENHGAHNINFNPYKLVLYNKKHKIEIMEIFHHPSFSTGNIETMDVTREDKYFTIKTKVELNILSLNFYTQIPIYKYSDIGGFFIYGATKYERDKILKHSATKKYVKEHIFGIENHYPNLTNKQLVGTVGILLRKHLMSEVLWKKEMKEI